MSKAAKGADSARAENVSFEEALQKLESIVEQMESGELPLETLLAKFEEGTKLAKACQTRLGEAELKIQKLEKNAAGDAVTVPLEPEESDNE
jgi:exodeoxyribonuclease VII small subunit